MINEKPAGSDHYRYYHVSSAAEAAYVAGEAARSAAKAAQAAEAAHVAALVAIEAIRTMDATGDDPEEIEEMDENAGSAVQAAWEASNSALAANLKAIEKAADTLAIFPLLTASAITTNPQGRHRVARRRPKPPKTRKPKKPLDDSGSIKQSNQGEPMMNKLKAKRMFEEAVRVVPNPTYGHPEDRAKQWRELDEKEFLNQYCQAVFAGGLSWAVMLKHLEGLREVFKDFDPEAVADMEPVEREKLPIKRKDKADKFLETAKMIHREGWDAFKKRLKREGPDMLRELPFIKDTMKKQLAQYIGLADTSQESSHLKRCAEHCGASSVGELVGFLAAEFKMQRRQVDAILWEWCAKHRPF